MTVDDILQGRLVYESLYQEDWFTSLAGLAYIKSYRDDELTTESSSLRDLLKAVGASREKGLVDYITSFAKGAGRLLLAAIKGDRDKTAEIAKSISKADFIDFVYKLDMASMHVISGPIHLVEAVTGWNVISFLRDKLDSAERIMDELIESFKEFKNRVSSVFKKDHPIHSAVDDIENVISLGDYR